MANIANNFSSTMITIMKDVIERYEKNTEIIKQTEGELQDILHEIELSKSKDMYGGYKLYKQVKDLRMKRRTAKDEQQLLEEMYKLFKSQQGQEFRTKIKSIQSNAAKAYEAQKSRTYTPRYREDLTIVEKTCETNPTFEDMLIEFNKNKPHMQGGKMRK